MAYRKYVAELFGTAVLVLIGCSSIVLAGFGGAFPIGIIGIGMTFGMTVTAMAYTIGPVSGCHLNPSVTAAVWSAGRMKSQDAMWYMVAQLAGGILGAFVTHLIVNGKIVGYDVSKQGLDKTNGMHFPPARDPCRVCRYDDLHDRHSRSYRYKRLNADCGLVIGLTLMIMHLHSSQCPVRRSTVRAVWGLRCSSAVLRSRKSGCT